MPDEYLVDRIQHLVPTACGRDDAIGVGRPDEGLRAAIVLGEEAIDRGLEVDERTEDAAFEAAAREPGEKALDGVEPGGRGRGEVKCPTRVTGQPGPDFGMFVAAIVVKDDMDQSAGRDLAFDAVDKAEKLLVPMALHALPEDGPVEQVERGKQRRRAVADVVVGHCPGPALLHRQTRLRAIKGLDLALLIDRQHQAVRRRVEVKADDVMHFGGELRIAAEFEDTAAGAAQGHERARLSARC